MGFYTNIRSDVSLVKQTVDMIFASKSHTCHCEDFICILNSEGPGYWYHVYRADDFIMRFVRCERVFRSNGSIFGPAYYTETDDVFEVNMIEMLEDRNRAAYQNYVNSITLYRCSNMRVIAHSYSGSNSSSEGIVLEFSTLSSYYNPKFLIEKIY